MDGGPFRPVRRARGSWGILRLLRCRCHRRACSRKPSFRGRFLIVFPPTCQGLCEIFYRVLHEKRRLLHGTCACVHSLMDVSCRTREAAWHAAVAGGSAVRLLAAAHGPHAFYWAPNGLWEERATWWRVCKQRDVASMRRIHATHGPISRLMFGRGARASF